MKILELKLLHAGYNENKKAIKNGLPEPYPEIKYPVDRISILVIDFGNEDVCYVRLLTPGHEYMHWKHEESFEHMIYFNLVDQAIGALKLRINNQANKILGIK